MTKKEAIKFLNDTKVYVNGKSAKIQEKLFALGYKWDTGDKHVVNTGAPFIFIYSNATFGDYNDMNYFAECTMREVTPEDILNITIDEPKYRPFKDAKECWNEMLKHQPFGWSKHKEKQIYENWICVDSNSIDETSFNDAYKDYTFADGTPFGIKED